MTDFTGYSDLKLQVEICAIWLTCVLIPMWFFISLTKECIFYKACIKKLYFLILC